MNARSYKITHVKFRIFTDIFLGVEVDFVEQKSKNKM